MANGVTASDISPKDEEEDDITSPRDSKVQSPVPQVDFIYTEIKDDAPSSPIKQLSHEKSLLRSNSDSILITPEPKGTPISSYIVRGAKVAAWGAIIACATNSETSL